MPRTKDLTGSGFSPLQATSITGALDPAVTALGTNLATAYLIGQPLTKVTTTASGTGVALPVINVTIGDQFEVSNDGANALLVYAPSGGTIDGAASKSIAAASWNLFQLWSADGLTWKSK